MRSLPPDVNTRVQAFLDKLAADGKTPSENLIGRFGVGFYSAFMVADRIDVYTSAGAGGDGAHKWSSAGDGQYTIRQAQPDEAPEQGTRMVLHLKEDAKYFSFRAEVRNRIHSFPPSCFPHDPRDFSAQRYDPCVSLMIGWFLSGHRLIR